MAGTRITKNASRKFVVDLDLHQVQQVIFNSTARFRIVGAGRRLGKTVLGTAECIIAALGKPNAEVWWVAPSHAQTRIAKRMLLKTIPRQMREVNNTLGEITLDNGSRIVLRSAERYDNLRGEGIDFVVVDEGAFIDKEAWTDALRPALSDKAGRALLISTFDGENWYWDAYQAAIDEGNTDWEGFRFPTSANPYIPASEIEAARRNLPKEVFEQEYEANPMSFVGMIFEGMKVQEAWEAGQAMVWQPNLLTEAGLDWGWNETAFEVCQELPDGQIAWLVEHRWHHVELTERCKIIADECRRMGVEVIYADAAGATENSTLATILAQLRVRTEVQPVPFNAYKTLGVTSRRFYLENGREFISRGCPALLADTKGYRYDPKNEKPMKVRDHTVDAATAFYASRSHELQWHDEGPNTEVA